MDVCKLGECSEGKEDDVRDHGPGGCVLGEYGGKERQL